MDEDRLRAEAGQLPNGTSVDRINNWVSPGSVAFDFRSDTVTTPTARMLQAITATTLADDVFQEDLTTMNFEAMLASLTGKEAALFVMSGTMGNQVALRTLLQGPPHSIVLDQRSHIFVWEAGGVASWSQALCRPVIPKNGRYMTLEDVQGMVDLRDDPHACPTKLICLENTIAGCIVPLEECRRISAWARDQSLLMHLDGARLWEAVAAGAGTLKEYCEYFDSMSLCFSKGLGAPIRSIVVGSKEFRHRAIWIRKAMGGGTRQLGVLTSAARVAVEDTFIGGQLNVSHARAQHVARIWEKYGGKTTEPVETNMVWIDLAAAGITVIEFVKQGQRLGLKLSGGRLVVHYQICDEAVMRVEKLAQAILDKENSS